MSPSTVALLLVVVPLALAVVPVVSAFRSRALFPADVGLVFLPALAFVAALLAFNEPAQTGWALIAYPFFVLWLCVLALYVRVFMLPRLGVNARRAAFGALLAAVMAAALFGAYVPPFYE
jgi:hypothetical protein